MTSSAPPAPNNSSHQTPLPALYPWLPRRHFYLQERVPPDWLDRGYEFGSKAGLVVGWGKRGEGMPKELEMQLDAEKVLGRVSIDEERLKFLVFQ
ncbi:hypothetical protein BDZ91DRAFT_792130 [Kalaharituber pfeilii]|nr:hypothetical protein BDZ91DRAFT_792130 [Kalaharituber pfeilii]